MGESAEPKQLKRELGTFGAMMMGLGSIVGTGVFVSIGIAAGAAGPAVLLAILAAAALATVNGLSSAQLAANHPVSGGTYEYGYRYLTPSMGFAAGWMFLLAKSASAATAALGFAGYLRLMLGMQSTAVVIALALGAVVALTAIVLSGLRRSNVTNIVIVSITLVALGFFVAAGAGPAVRGAEANLDHFFSGGVRGLLEASALMFVAYTGYGRIATLGEEVRRPRRTIPRAIIVTLVVSMLLYAAVGAVAIAAVGSEDFAASTRSAAAPLEAVARTFKAPGAGVVLAIGAVTAMLGVLLNLILGLSRVLLAMGRRGDMPGALGRLNAAGTTPTAATVVVGVVIAALVLIGDVKTTWSFSAFTVLLYYALTNLSALRLSRNERFLPRWVSMAGLGGCLFLAFWVDIRIWAAGLGLLVVGLAWHFVARRLKAAGPRQ